MLALLTAVLLTLSAGAAEGKTLTEAGLQACYEKHPFLLEAIAVISDDDFADRTKSAERKRTIQTEFDKNRDSVIGCLEDMTAFAKKEYDNETIKHTLHRLSEISSIVYRSNGGASSAPAVR